MASLDFTDIAEVGSKGRDDGSFLVQVSGVGSPSTPSSIPVF